MEKPKILITDDDKSLCESLKDVLELNGYLTEISHTAEGCIEKIESSFYSIVLLDLKLPDSNGIKVLEKIKDISPDTEVIIFTAFAETDSVIEAIDRKAFSYLPKPFEIPHLIKTLEKACESQRIIFENSKLLQQLSRAKIDWENTFDSISDLISIHDNDFSLLKCNKAFARKFNAAQDGLSGKRCYEIFHETSEPCHACSFVKCKETLKSVTEELESPGMGGVFQVTCFPRIDDAGKLNGVVHIAKDITERKRIEKELADERHNLEKTVKVRTKELSEALKKTEDARNREQQLYAKLEENYEALQRAEHARDSMSHMIVHDLCNFLSVVLSNVQLLQYNVNENNINREELLRGLQVSRNSIKEMTFLINSILDVSKLEAGEMPVSLTDISSLHFIKNIYEQYAIQAREKEIHLTIEYDSDDIKAKADKALLNRIIQNLLSNTLKHTKAETEVTLTAKKKEGRNIVFCVADNGPGIPDEYKDKIFDKFFQIDIGRKRKKHSIGLGLTFCKMAAEAQGGKIWVESREGEGSSFKVALEAY